METASELRAMFPLEADVAYFNHGAFGVAPWEVLRRQAEIRIGIERQPARFVEEQLQDGLASALDQVASALGAHPDDLVFVDNATTAANAVLDAVPLSPGSVILTTTHVYPGVRSAIAHRCRRTGAIHREVPVALPVEDSRAIFDAFAPHLVRGVALVVIDHIASASAIVFPIDEITRAAHDVGARVFVDGAHAPGQVPVDCEYVAADFWTGNLHKWMFAPRGTAVLYASERARADLAPPVVSIAGSPGWRDAFHWPGTRDFSSWLAVPAALSFIEARGGLRAIHQAQRARRAAAVGALRARWGLLPLGSDAVLAAMATFRLPLPKGDAASAQDLHRRLRHRHAVEVPTFSVGGDTWLRISTPIYVTDDDVERLGNAVAAEVGL